MHTQAPLALEDSPQKNPKASFSTMGKQYIGLTLSKINYKGKMNRLIPGCTSHILLPNQIHWRVSYFKNMMNNVFVESLYLFTYVGKLPYSGDFRVNLRHMSCIRLS